MGNSDYSTTIHVCKLMAESFSDLCRRFEVAGSFDEIVGRERVVRWHGTRAAMKTRARAK